MTTPAYIISGDTHVFRWSHTDYPTSEWTLKFSLVGPSVLNVTATADGDDFVITLTAAQTTVLKSGIYTYGYRVILGDTAYTVEAGTLAVKDNPASLVPKINVAEQMIAYIDSALLNQLSEGEAYEALSLAGRSISFMNRTELLDERARWQSELSAFRRAARGGSAFETVTILTGRI